VVRVVKWKELSFGRDSERGARQPLVLFS
jgi:hypothetical protein